MKQIKFVLLTTAIVLSNVALAHGDENHAKKSAPVAKEQMGWGIAGDAKAAKRVIEIRMLDTMRFSPEKIEVKQGDTVKFVIKNTGAILHEFVIGTQDENDKHAALMLKFPNMEHDAPYMAHVAPGKTGAIVWTFNKAGEFDFACLIAGHYQGGMKGKILVAAAAGGAASGSAQMPEKIASATTQESASSGEMADGEVRKIDKGNKKITIKHGEIKNLDMPPMTMVFQVKDAAMVDQVKNGDSVKFVVEKIGGAMVVTRIEPAPAAR